MADSVTARRNQLDWIETLRRLINPSVKRFQGGGGQNPRQGRDPGSNRIDLSHISWKEVQKSRDLLSYQFVSTDNIDELRVNQFCNLKLVHSNGGYPPEIFGRVASRYPTAGPLHQLSLLELFFPSFESSLSLVAINGELIDYQEPHQAWYVQVPIWGVSEDFSVLEDYYELFQEKGFEIVCLEDPEPIWSVFSLSEKEKQSLPWIYVISSNWLSRLDPDIYRSVLPNLRILVSNPNRILINFHPEPTNIQVNKVFQIKPGLHKPHKPHFLDADTIDDILEIVEVKFTQLLSQPLSRIR